MKSLFTRIFTLVTVASILSSCASTYLKNGKKAYSDLKYQDAIWYFEKGLTKKEDSEARKMLAESYLMVNDVDKAKDTYALTNAYTDNTDEDRLKQGKALMAKGNYDEASTIFEGIISRDPSNSTAKELLLSCQKHEDMMADSLFYSVSPLNIPGAMSPYSATPLNDGLIISAPSTKGDKDPYTNKAFTDLYFTKNTASGWTNPEALTSVNSKYHDAVAVVSPDGNTLVFTRSFSLKGGALAGNDKNVSNTQLYMSRKGSDGQWSKPEMMPFSDPKFMYAHPTYSADGSILYFSSDKDGGQGKMDIYSIAATGGGWGTPTNLGPTVNTKGNDVFPTMLGNDTLYFSSDSHRSLGKLDIVYTSKSNGSWTEPQHVSYPINSERDDFGLIWNSDRNGGYFTSSSSGGDLIYSFTYEVPELVYKGMVTGKKSMLPLGGAKITLKNLTDGTEDVYYSDGNGEYDIELMPGKDYQMITELDGYFNVSDNVSTKGKRSSEEINKVTELNELIITKPEDTAEKTENTGTVDPKNGKDSKDSKGDVKTGKDGKDGKDGKVGKDGKDSKGSKDAKNGKDSKDSKTGSGKEDNKGIYDIPNIHWDYNKWDIRRDAEPYLNDLVKLFKDNQQVKFEIRSHTIVVAAMITMMICRKNELQLSLTI
jgi:outer membrane protein OmpA-like peptidoglycan-associated protein